MRKTLFAFFLLGVLTTPFLAQAQNVSDLQAQIQSLLNVVAGMRSQIEMQYNAGGVSSVINTVVPVVQATAPDLLALACPRIHSSLSLGAHDRTTGGAVSELQQFLVSSGVYPEAQITGYFGPMTAQAVARLQARYGLETAGRVGPQTRALVARLCSGSGITPQPPMLCTMEYDPVCGQPPYSCPQNMFCASVMPAPKTYGNRCMLQADNAEFLYAGECGASTNNNKPPVISGFSGPTELSSAQMGTWSVSAYDPESGSLSYAIDWGDTYAPVSYLQGAYEAYFKQTTTFTHSYSAAGTYTVRITVRDDTGQSTETTTTVRVGGGGTIACTREYNPVCGLGMHPCCVGPSHPEYTTACYTMKVSCTETKKTYSNICTLQASGAQLLHYGECDLTGGTAPESCKIWYDGCNTCSRAYAGGPLMCTMMACFQNAGAYCREYF